MRGPAPDIPEFAERFETAEPPIRPRSGIVAAALAAALASGGLAWWLGGEDRGRIELSQPAPAANAPAAPAAKAVAPPDADPGQVRRAYDQVQSTYADGGAPALADFARECAETLSADPRILDFCLAFDMYASALSPEEGEAADWFRVGEARRLRLAREALPSSADPQGRVSEIAGLMRIPSGVPAQATPVRTAPAPASAPAPARKARPAAVSRCRFESTPAQRMLCANPALQAADARMQRAYRRALAAGADREILEGEQAAWRTARNGASGSEEMADLYARRLRELAQHAARD